MNEKPDAILLVGPTASGKTAFALDLAKKLPIEIISVDSALVYKGMDIGTAKPTAEELASVPHHLIDIITPLESYSAAQFAEDCTRLVREIRGRGRLPMIVGGTIDDYGWYEWTYAPWMGFGSGGGVNTERIYYIVDGVTYDADSFESRWGSMGPFGMDWTMVTQDRQWVVAAAKELKIPFVPSAAETDTTLPAP